MLFNLFKSKEVKEKGPNYFSLKVREVVKETEDTVTIYFEQPEPYLEYKPGQYLTVLLDVDGKQERRSYSLCTSPYVDPYPGITVKRVSEGVISNFLNDKIRPGKSIEVMKPMGHFTLDFHSKNKTHYVMVAAGSGITPIMGLLKSVLVNEPHSGVTLIYCSRSEGQIIFRKALDELKEKYADRLRIINNLTQPSESWDGLKGRLDAQRIKELILQHPRPETSDTKYLICGPTGIMQATLEALDELGVDRATVHKESFFIAPTGSEEKAIATQESPLILSQEVTVVVEGEEYQFEVAPEQTILEAGLEEDVDMPYSCQSGLCTSCRGKLISGKVKMDEDAGLSENELREGYVLCCVSHPLTADVKINIE